MSKIKAGTTTTTAYQVEADTTGTLVLQTGATPTTAVTIDSSQNVGMSIAAPAAVLDVYREARISYASGNQYRLKLTNTDGNGRLFADGDASNLIFGTAPAGTNATAVERMRIDTSGNLLVGTTSNYGGGRLDVAWDGTGNAAAVRATSASFTGAAFITYADRNTTNSTFKGIAYYNVGAGAYKFIVQDSGNVQNVNNSYGAISDIKLKENITDATPKLAQLNQVRVVNYNLIGDTNKQIGVVAQELEQVFPSIIDEEVDRDSEGNDLGTTTKSVKYSVFVPMLIKAIQEQQALITQLQADVAALKGAA
jgi:hypothetical protein